MHIVIHQSNLLTLEAGYFRMIVNIYTLICGRFNSFKALNEKENVIGYRAKSEIHYGLDSFSNQRVLYHWYVWVIIVFVSTILLKVAKLHCISVWLYYAKFKWSQKRLK